MSLKQLRVIAPAKLNLFLHITGRRADGYHELETLFTFLNYGDSLLFEETDSNHIELAPVAGITKENNLIYKAAIAIQNAYQSSGYSTHGVHISIDKKLPMGGGVGGGSSDAATTLLTLNSLWGNKLSLAELADIGLALGADVPVFVHGFSALAKGVGEQLEPVELESKWYLVAHPNVHISTADVFTDPNLPRNTPKLDKNWQDAILNNDCEQLVKNRYSEVEKLLNWLLKYAPSRMTGTGACCFAAFSSEQEAKQALEKLPSQWSGFVAQSLNKSPAHVALGLAQ